jgi:transcriptional antiterminator NusG
MRDLAFTCAAPADDGAHWFAVWTRNQCEPKVAALLARKNIEVFLPRVQQASRRRDRRVLLDRPLFPGYVFPRFTPSRQAYLAVVGTDGVARILGERWDQLHAVPDEQIEAVRRLVAAGAGPRPVPWIRIGDRVRITAGALAGLEGFVQDWRAGRARFVVSIDLLRRSVAIEVPSELLERV